MKRWPRTLLILGLLLLVIVGLRWTVLRPRPIPVTVYTVERGTVEATVVNSRAGTLRSRHRAKLSPAVGGTVAEILVRKGDRVQAGQLLLRLDDQAERAQLELAGRALDAARAGEQQVCLQAEQAEREFARRRTLAEERVIAEESLEQIQTRRDMALAACTAAREQTRQAEAQRKLAQAALSKTRLLSPFSGVVADLSTETGEWISPSPPGVPIPAIMELIDLDSLYVSAPVDEVDIGRIRAGLPVRMTLDPFPGEVFRGHVSRVAPYVQDFFDQNRTLEVEAVFDEVDVARKVDLSTSARANHDPNSNPQPSSSPNNSSSSNDGSNPNNNSNPNDNSNPDPDPLPSSLASRLLPGISTDVEIILETREDVLRVPTTSLLEGNQVLVVQAGKLQAKTVTTGLRNWEFTEVTSGLAPGDRVVVSLDREEIKAGARVRVLEPDPAVAS